MDPERTVSIYLEHAVPVLSGKHVYLQLVVAHTAPGESEAGSGAQHDSRVTCCRFSACISDF